MKVSLHENFQIYGIMLHCAYTQLLLHVRVIDVLPCPNNALSCQSHDMLHPVHVQCIPDPFPRGRARSLLLITVAESDLYS